MGKKQEPLFDEEARNWESLYKDSPEERWGLFQSYARKRVQARLDLCLSLLPPVRGRDVIELGCGPGYYGARLIRKGANWSGVDLSEKMLKLCRRNTRSDCLIRANVLALPFLPDSCDAMLCIGVLSYLRKREISSLLSDASSIIRPGGFLLTQTVRFDPITWVRCRLPGIVPRPLRIPGPFFPRNPETIKRLLLENGFSLQRTVSYKKFALYPAGTIYLARKTG